MMKLKLKFFFLICLLLFSAQSSLADEKQLVISSDMQFDYALKCYNDKDYQTSIVEFKRFIHFFSDDQRVIEARFKTGKSFYHLKEYARAAKVFNDIILMQHDSEYTNESYFMQSNSFFKMGNYGYAKLVLHNYLKLTDDQQIKDRIHYQMAQIYLKQPDSFKKESLNRAKESLAQISDQNALSYHKEDQINLVARAKNASHKDPSTAGLLAIVPGAGFLYCERYKDAFVTFCLNVGLILAAYESFDQGNEALGGVLSFVEAGFYSGNVYGSISSAHKYNKEKTLKVLNDYFVLTSGVDLDKKAFAVSFKHDF